MKNNLSVLSTLFALGIGACLPSCASLKQVSATDSNNTSFSVGSIVSKSEQLSDLKQIATLLESTHPDPTFTMDIKEVKKQLAKLERDIKSPMSQHDYWKVLSQLNPYFEDAHMAVIYPDYEAKRNAYLERGGKMFPFEVTIDNQLRIFVSASNTSEKWIEKGDEIKSINGIEASVIISEILSRTHGDSNKFRLALASKRFSKMFLLLFGGASNYDIEIERNSIPSSYTVKGASSEDLKLGTDTDNLERKILRNNIGYLKIDKFMYSREDAKQYFSFMDESWKEFKDANVEDVIIDVRENEGGTDIFWQIGIAPYIANKPFPFISHFKARMTERNIKLGPLKGELGTILEGPFTQEVPISIEKENRISGKAYLLMGPQSYSSTILFLTSFQDSNQAVIVGEPNGARSCSTGRVEKYNLTGAQIDIVLPTVLFSRPAGKSMCENAINPDIYIPNNPFDKNAAVETLVDKISFTQGN